MKPSPPETSSSEPPILELGLLPQHIAIIMDGNGRWAERRRLTRTEGHRQGSSVVREVVRACRRLGVRSLTLYAFSAQNWERPPTEVAALMQLLFEFLGTERSEILDNDVRLVGVGDLERLPAFVRERLERLCAESASNGGMELRLALSYGGREEIARAARSIAEDVEAGRLDPRDVDEAEVARRLPSLGAGDVDLLVRTGGEFRISNFLLWASAYAELYFTETLWPDFTVEELYRAIAAYGRRERRFGRVRPAAGSRSAAAPGGSRSVPPPERASAR